MLSVPVPGVTIGELGSFLVVYVGGIELSESDEEVILPLGGGEGSHLCIFCVICEGYFKLA